MTVAKRFQDPNSSTCCKNQGEKGENELGMYRTDLVESFLNKDLRRDRLVLFVIKTSMELLLASRM